jgi:circadian clock protein KaiB
MKKSSSARTESDVLVFQLFVAGDEPHSKMAIKNLNEICESHIKDHCEIQILDVFKSYDIALEKGIYLTPALVRTSPLPRITIFGNLSDRGKVLATLQLAEKE